jgi:hypothetical protein
VWTAEQEAQNIKEQIRIHRNRHLRGFSILWSTILLMVLACSWSGWAWLAVHDHFEIINLRKQLWLQDNMPQRTVYDIKIDRIVSADSIEFTSPGYGKFRGDFCPALNISKYEPKVGYVMCRLRYTDNGCIAKQRDDDGWTFVKSKDGWTATIGPDDTYQPWPKCLKDDLVAQDDNAGGR